MENSRFTITIAPDGKTMADSDVTAEHMPIMMATILCELVRMASQTNQFNDERAHASAH